MKGIAGMAKIYKSEAGARAVAVRYREVLARWPVAHRHFLVPTRQGETFIVASGPEDAPPLLLFHGSSANAAMWMSDVAVWARDFRVYAVDMIGEPGLSAPSRPPLASDAHALWLDDVMRELGLAQTSVVGVSLGGWLALDYATRRPGRVVKLALLCPGGVGRQKNFLWKALPLLLLGDWGRRRLRQTILGRTPAATTPATRDFAQMMSLIFKFFRPRFETLPVFGDDALKRLAMPLLAIVGGRDVLLDSAETRRRLERNVARAEIHYLPDAGHYLRGQTERIHEFLRRAA